MAQAGAVCENLPQCHFLPRRVHGLHRVGKKFAQCGGPIQLAFLDDHREERRRHGFGARTKVKSIIERDALCGPSLSNPGGALGDDALAPQNGGSTSVMVRFETRNGEETGER